MPRKLNLDDPAKIIEIAERGGGLPSLEAGQTLKIWDRNGTWCLAELDRRTVSQTEEKMTVIGFFNVRPIPAI
jgi:hypothetical protein